MLEPSAEIALAAGDVVAARDAADRLGELAAGLEAPLLRAMAARTEARCASRKATSAGALAVLRRAWEAWRELDAPYEAARVRARPLRRAASSVTATGPRSKRGRTRGVRTSRGPSGPRQAARDSDAAAPGGLSAREVEVLRLVAAGHTNRAIAESLTISERTVDRHVSNIFTKLDVSTRAAATAFAYEHGLV